MTSAQRWIAGVIIAAVAIGVVIGVLVMRSASDSDISNASPDDVATSLVEESKPTEPPEVAWAGEVCAAVDNLRSVSGAATLQALGDIDPSGDLTEQATDQLAEVMAELQDPLAQLGAALGAVPVDYTEDPQRLLRAQQLTASAVEQVRQTTEAIGAVGEAESFVDQAVRAVAAIAAGQQVVNTGRELLDALEQLDADRAYREAFSKAPQCTSL